MALPRRGRGRRLRRRRGLRLPLQRRALAGLGARHPQDQRPGATSPASRASSRSTSRSATEDPCNQRMTLVHELLEDFRYLGTRDLTWRAYPDARHEILNETNRDEVQARPAGLARQAHLSRRRSAGSAYRPPSAPCRQEPGDPLPQRRADRGRAPPGARRSARSGAAPAADAEPQHPVRHGPPARRSRPPSRSPPDTAPRAPRPAAPAAPPLARRSAGRRRRAARSSRTARSRPGPRSRRARRPASARRRPPPRRAPPGRSGNRPRRRPVARALACADSRTYTLSSPAAAACRSSVSASSGWPGDMHGPAVERVQQRDVAGRHMGEAARAASRRSPPALTSTPPTPWCPKSSFTCSKGRSTRKLAKVCTIGPQPGQRQPAARRRRAAAPGCRR